ncbi:MAG: DNA-3-methyladenine glycosylase [Ilumatobacteraceae bacterium]
MRRLPPDWARRDALDVAPDLLGRLIEIRGVRARVTEVEAYTADDPASHSFRGRTARNASMFATGGCWYVYLIYGVHLCLNLVTGTEGDGQAVLVRSVLVDGVDAPLTTGPGRLSRALDVGRDLDGAPAAVFDDGWSAASAPLVTTRIGISKGTDLLRRWVLVDQRPSVRAPRRTS